MGLVVRKPALGVCNKVWLKIACSATGINQNIKVLHVSNRGSYISAYVLLN